MMQRGQVFTLKSGGEDRAIWAYRLRIGGRGSRRVQRGGFPSEQAATDALDRALERLRREQGLANTPTLLELVDMYLAQHDVEPETLEKLGWLLSKATRSFGVRPVSDLRPAEIAAWRMTIPPGHRVEATQALRQTLARAVSWGMLNTNPAKRGVENPQRPRFEQRPFETLAELHRLAGRIGPRYGPLVMFAAATGLRPGERLALEHRDIDHQARVVYVRRALRNGRIKNPKTDSSIRAVPLQATALAALEQLTTTPHPRSYSPPHEAGTSTCTTSATATGNPRNARSGSTRCEGSTISDTRSLPSRSVPESRPSTSPATWVPA